MKKLAVVLAIAFTVTLVGACNNEKTSERDTARTPPTSPEKTETAPPAVEKETPSTTETTSSPTTEVKVERKKSLKDTAWDFTWDNTTYKRLEFTSDANVTLKGGDAPEAGIPGMFTLAEDGTFTLTAGDINDSGIFDGTVLKVAEKDGKKDPIYPDDFDPTPTNEVSSRR